MGLKGENTPFVLSNNPKLQDQLNTWLNQLGIQYSINAENANWKGSIVSGGDAVLLSLSPKNNPNTRVTLNDVGFGINQILPIIVQALIQQNGTLMIEQPEIHLHPKLQGEISDLMIETHKKNNLNWIVETHSEMLILRLLKRIREGTLKSSDVSVIYVDQTESGEAIIHKLPIDEKGSFVDRWPNGFFEETFNELMDD